MPRSDWLVGGDRRNAAAERIYDAAADLIAHDGLNDLDIDIDKLATRVHCSRATIYRYAGGKTEIRNAVIARAAARIVDSVHSLVAPLSGHERLVEAVVLSIRKIRSDPLAQLMVGSIRGGTREVGWLAGSPLLAQFATDLTGLTGSDPLGAEWVVRVVLSLMYWPGEDDDAERMLVERFVGQAFGAE